VSIRQPCAELRFVRFVDSAHGSMARLLRRGSDMPPFVAQRGLGRALVRGQKTAWTTVPAAS
jgi:hypothetical protein